MKLRLGLCTQPLLSLAKGGGLSRGPTTPERKKEKTTTTTKSQGTATKTTMHINSGNGDEVKGMDRFGNDASGGARWAQLPPPHTHTHLIFRPNWGPKGRKKFLERPSLPLIWLSGWPDPIRIWRFGSATGRYRDLRSTAEREWKTSQRKIVGNLEKDNIRKVKGKQLFMAIDGVVWSGPYLALSSIRIN